ncbi:MAG: RagB/SusD family nutrient uptake outer membrane protein [Wenyingzhuangia sp.]|uniref:RagB/SusD family nutrient uptake outer membrane protein n=1 Tax=Wenyingzhuangia sp. TaxID=1964193 RepID=UPI00321A2AFB
MKTYKYLLLLIGLSVTGCSDLVEEPKGLLAPEGFFQTTEDIQTAINATYAHAYNEQIWGRKLSNALMLRSDMAAFRPTGSTARRVEMDTHTITDDNEMVYDPWNRIYRGIAAANEAIAGAALVDVPDAEKNPVVAQAYFMRAFYYFHLVRLFGEVPYLTEPVTATTAEAQAKINKTSAEDVYKGIIKDLEFAEAHLPNTQPARSLPSAGAAKSYLALVYLTKGDWQDAYDKAKEVINNKAAYDYELDSDFQNLFNADVIDASKEPIFALDYNNVEASDNAYDQVAPMTGIRNNYRFGAGNGGWAQVVPEIKVFNDWPAGDYRRAVSFDDKAVFFGDHDSNEDTPDEAYEVNYTEFGTADGSVHEQALARPFIAKYYRFPGTFARGAVRATSHNPSMMRYAEVLLIAAEAAVEIGNQEDAVTYVNLVRARARAGGSWANDYSNTSVPADISGTVTVNDVLEERRYELAFECKRWYDIARRKIGAQAFGPNGLEVRPEFSDADYLTPIPNTEIDSNPNLE